GAARALALHLGAAAAFALANLLTRVAERQALGGTGAELSPARDVNEPVSVFVTYLVVAGLAHAVVYARRYRREQLAELRLQATLAEAELQRTGAELRMLKMQLNPHFLFNSLHAVSALVDAKPADAQRMVVRLSDLLRRAMTSVATQEVPLEEEMAGLRPFVEVEQIRLGGNLSVEWKVDDEVLDALVPHMLLQPLVENAIKHGVAPNGGGRIEVRGRRDGEWLELSVADDGVGLADASAEPWDEASSEESRARAESVERRHGAGVGSANVRARLAQLYGVRHAFTLAPGEHGGAVATVRIPWHDTPVDAAPLRAAAFDGDAGREGGGSRARHPDVLPVEPVSRLTLAVEWTLAGLWIALTWARGFEAHHAETVVRGGRGAWALAFLYSGLNATLWAAVLLVAAALTRRHPLVRGRVGRGMRVHAAAAVGLGCAVVVGKMGFRALMGYRPGELLPASVGGQVLAVVLLYVLFAGVAHAAEYARRYRRQQLAELRLQATLAEAELQRTGAELRMLKMQLNPHFLFNSLHAVSALVDARPADAQRMVVRLSDLLRRAMTSVATQEVPLEEEMAGLRPFVEVEQIRLGGNLSVEWKVDDDVLDALVPHMLLQPLMENAIKHGVAPNGGGRIEVRGRRDGEWLELSVADDGVGLADASAEASDEAPSEESGAPSESVERRHGAGVGSANVRARLAQLYGVRHAFTLAPGENGGAVATVRIPWHDTPLEGGIVAPKATAA
ncbi:MAG: Autolysin sensor kinase, partial [Gemmatimonadetes bacterium]|nr:Autolysin sensor kinase [Gemmatimonadota bacterium]